MSLRDRLRDAIERASEVERELSDPKTVRDQQRMAALGREHHHLQALVEMGNKLQRLEQELAETRELADSDDPEMATEAKAEAARLEQSISALLDRIKPALLPHDPLDDRPAIVEIRGGTGGDEAALFAADLLRMYTRFAEGRRWRIEVISQSDGTLGGVKEAIFKVKGEGAFGVMRWESGVHRVQRVPVTESQGRIHTSAATVAVLPEAEEIDLKIEDKDLRIDVFRSSGPGGQSVNTTDSAVRITPNAPSPLTLKMASFTPPSVPSDWDMTSMRQRRPSAKRVYMRRRSAANNAASSPPVPPLISTMAGRSSSGSCGRRAGLMRSSSALIDCSRRAASAFASVAISGSSESAS
ncbi:MAG TPA: PCRF domain-containing protein, partial [Bradyrhizobium sp.]|nr:PCRF domain-containing protein [Bradyrhizobium sp.]